MAILKKILSFIFITMSILLYQNCTPFEISKDGSSVSEMNYFVGLFDKVIAPNCLTCHSGTSPSGNTDLSSHAAIIASGKVNIGASSSSPLYTTVLNGTSPEHSSLSENQLIALAEWIDGGARENEIPEVSAGADKTVRLPESSVTLTGQASDIDGSIVSYSWRQSSGPNSAVLSNSNTRILTASGLVEGTYVFGFQATDEKGGSFEDLVSVSVAIGNNQLPTVELGINRNITLPTSTITLTSSSSDSDGTISAFLWTQTFGPSSATLTNTNLATLSVSNLVQGSYIFKLEVTDDRGGKGSDTVTVDVNPAPTTYTQLRSSIFLPLCIGCHSGSNPRGGYNMSTYTALMTEVRAGNASSSNMYQRIIDGTMPPGGGISIEETNSIRDWINAGAFNN